jgi:hypothetical protein
MCRGHEAALERFGHPVAFRQDRLHLRPERSALPTEERVIFEELGIEVFEQELGPDEGLDPREARGRHAGLAPEFRDEFRPPLDDLARRLRPAIHHSESPQHHLSLQGQQAGPGASVVPPWDWNRRPQNRLCPSAIASPNRLAERMAGSDTRAWRSLPRRSEKRRGSRCCPTD